jgi:hypothetical protein
VGPGRTIGAARFVRMTVDQGESVAHSAGRLGPETSGTLKRALQYYLEYEREFVALFFPRITERSYVTLADVSELTARQADALRPLLADSVRYFRRQEEKELARLAGASSASSEVARKAELWADALREMCASFKLSDPLDSDP